MKKFGFVILVLLIASIIALPFVLREPLQEPKSRMPHVSSSLAKSLAHVVRAVDGDTLVVTIGGKEERVRILGIDTPETVDIRKKVQCYGPEASARMKELLEGTSVALEAKPDEDRDDYDRLLRYVFLGDEDIGALMLREGYARSLCFTFPHPKCSEYEVFESSARRARLGRWGACD